MALSKNLFSKCIELAPVFALLLARPTQLHLYPQEFFFTSRPLASVEAPAFAVADMPQMAHYVHQRACFEVQRMTQLAPALPAPPTESTVTAQPAEEESAAITSDAVEADPEPKSAEDGGVKAPEAAGEIATVEPAPKPSVTVDVPEPKAAPAEPEPATPSQKAEEKTEEQAAEEQTPSRKRKAEQETNVPATPATPATPSTPSTKKISSMTVAELKEALSARGLDTSGLKKDLVKRYTDAVDADK
jgi:hypothetical protein